MRTGSAICSFLEDVNRYYKVCCIVSTHCITFGFHHDPICNNDAEHKRMGGRNGDDPVNRLLDVCAVAALCSQSNATVDHQV